LDELNREFYLENQLSYGKKKEENAEIINFPATNASRPEPAAADAVKKPKKKRKNAFLILSDVIFYAAVVFILFTIATSSQNGSPRMFWGYSYFTVLTSSMQSEIPKGSFILVKQVEPGELKVGDDITYIRSDNNTVTHKIINIYTNYADSGELGFQTQGVNNALPDENVVYAQNVVGKVVYSVPRLGAFITNLRANIFYVFLVFGLMILMSFVLRKIFSKPSSPESGDSKRDTGKKSHVKSHVYRAKAVSLLSALMRKRRKLLENT